MHKMRGQSFVEIAFIVPVLLIMLLGLFEATLAFSAYLQTVDSARNSARFASSNHPYPQDGFGVTPSAYDGQPNCFSTNNFFRTAACEAAINLKPIVANGDGDSTYFVISIFTIHDGAIRYRFDRNYGDAPANTGYLIEDDDCVGGSANGCGAVFYCDSTHADPANWVCNFHAANNAVHSAFSNDAINSSLVDTLDLTDQGITSITVAPTMAFIIIEVFHAHDLILNVPIISNFLGEQIFFHSYEVMPLPRANCAQPDTDIPDCN